MAQAVIKATQYRLLIFQRDFATEVKEGEKEGTFADQFEVRGK